MNINTFFAKIVRHLGLDSLSCEEYYPQIMEVLRTDTLNTFSQFFPYHYHKDIDLSTMKFEYYTPADKMYYFNDEFLEKNNLPILGIEDCQGASYFQEWNAPVQAFNVDAMILEGAASSIRSALNISTRHFKFFPPNRFTVKGYSGFEKLHLLIKIPYPNFGTVPDSVALNLERLAKLDIKIWLYSELKMYEQLETGDGSIDLKLTGWDNAEQERDALIDEWRNKAFPNSVYKPHVYE